MDEPAPPTCTAFLGASAVAEGPLPEVLARLASLADGRHALVLDHASGETVEIAPDFQALRFDAAQRDGTVPPAKPGRGRPKLGVVPREVTLLPRHWEWLAEQPGGASAALRRLVDSARRSGAEAGLRRRRRDGLYKAMAVLAGDLPGFEEATRALFADDLPRLARLAGAWPADVAAYVSGRAAELGPPPAAPPPGGQT